MADESQPREDEALSADDLASELGAQVGREAGGQLLEMARSALIVGAARQGPQTSEFRLTMLLVLAGAALAAYGAARGLPELQSQGVDLLKWAGVGYAASRGIAKAGAAVSQSKDQA